MVEVWRSIAYYVARNTSRASNQQAILGLVARRTPSNQRFEWSSHNHTDKKKKSTVRVLFLFGRSVEIRTPGLQYPKLARYQLRYTSKYSVFWLSVSLRCLSARPLGLPLHRRIVARYRLDTLGFARSLLRVVSLRKNNNQLFLARYYQLLYTSKY